MKGDAYCDELMRNLREFGAHSFERVEASAQLCNLDESPHLLSFVHPLEQRLLMTLGCSNSVHTGSYTTEFVLPAGPTEFERRILEYVAYFHLTFRHMKFAECHEIGSHETSAFTHVYNSVAFFFPPSVNCIEIDGVTHDLIWPMPIFPEEYAFIREHGEGAFEARLDASGYGFFERRTDLSYLDPAH